MMADVGGQVNVMPFCYLHPPSCEFLDSPGSVMIMEQLKA